MLAKADSEAVLDAGSTSDADVVGLVAEFTAQTAAYASTNQASAALEAADNAQNYVSGSAVGLCITLSAWMLVFQLGYQDFFLRDLSSCPQKKARHL